MARTVRHHHHIVRAAAVALVAALALHGAAGRAQAQVPTRLAYSANADGSLGIFSVSPATGALAALGSVQAPGDPTALTVDPSGRFVYAAHSNENLVSAYRIDGAGLALVGSVAANNPAALALDPSGRFLYVADAVLGEIYRFRIGSNGALTFAARTDAGSGAVALAVHPSGRFLYGLDAVTARVLAYRVDAGTGGLVAAGSSGSGAASPVTLALEPRGRFLYVLHHLQDVVTVFRIDPGTGATTQIQTLSVKNPVAVAVEQTGRFLYIASPGNDALFAYRISQTDGRLTAVATELLAQPAPVSVTIDPTNRFVYAASVAAGRVTRLTINAASGVLAEGASLPIAGRPIAVAVAHPTERFAYALATPSSDANDMLHAFRSDAATGALTLVDELALDDSLTELTLEPSGRFVYVLRRNSNAIETFRIDVSSGQLTSIQTLVVPELGAISSALTAESTGRFLYVTCLCSAANSRIRAFRINATSGLLTDLGATGGPGAFIATASATDLSGRFLYMARVNGGGIEAFEINQTTGLLTGLGATPYQSAAGELVMDPLGRFLFVANQTGFVEAFRVSAVTGALTSSGPPILMESGMRGASIDRTGRFFYPVTRGTGGSVHVFAIDPVNGDLEVSGVPAAYLGDSDVGESAGVDTTGRFLHVGHRVSVLGGIRTFAINPSTGAVTATSDVTLPFTPFSLGTSGRIR